MISLYLVLRIYLVLRCSKGSEAEPEKVNCYPETLKMSESKSET